MSKLQQNKVATFLRHSVVTLPKKQNTSMISSVLNLTR